MGLGFIGCGQIPSYASSTFESDAEEWTVSGNGPGLAQVTLKSTGGNPAGHLCGQDAKEGDVWYFVAPQKYLGDARASFGKRLTFDLKQETTYHQIRGRDVVLNGGGLSIVQNFRATPGTDWTPYSIRLDPQSGWSIDDPTGTRPAATEEDLRLVLGSLTALRIRGEYFDGPDDVTCLDNVFFGRD
jgi:hypothetical protein